MRKLIVRIVTIVLFIGLVTGGGIYYLKHKQHQEAVAKAQTEAAKQRAKQLAEWQAKVKAWPPKDATNTDTSATSSTATAASNAADMTSADTSVSTVAVSGKTVDDSSVAVLPNTGPGDLLLVLPVVALGTMGYRVVLVRRLSSGR